MRSSVLLVLLGIAIAVNGCGGSSSGGGRPAARGGCDAVRLQQRDRARDLATTCNVVAAGGACVTATFSTAAAPAPAGGTFAGGTYNLVSQTFYGSADVRDELPDRRTLPPDVCPVERHLDLVHPRSVWTTGTVVARARETAAVSGMTATFTQICPAPDAGIDRAEAPSSPRPPTRSRCSGRRRSECSWSPSSTRRRRRSSRRGGRRVAADRLGRHRRHRARVRVGRRRAIRRWASLNALCTWRKASASPPRSGWVARAR